MVKGQFLRRGFRNCYKKGKTLHRHPKLYFAHHRFTGGGAKGGRYITYAKASVTESRVAVNKGQSNRVTEQQRIRVVQLLAPGGEVDCEGAQVKGRQIFHLPMIISFI